MQYSPLRFPTNDQIALKDFKTVDEELVWIADEIEKNIRTEKVPPHEILVVSLAPFNQLSRILSTLQFLLNDRNIAAQIPAVTSNDTTFFTENAVTLTNVRRAKGNESAIVFVCNIDYLAHNPGNIPLRNSLFTAITRTKGWCYLSGKLDSNNPLLTEMKTVLQHLENDCKLDFNWPDVALIHKKITTYKQERAKKNQSNASQSAQDLVRAALMDPSVLENLDPGLKKQLSRLLGKE